MSQYDPDAPEGARPTTSQYMSVKDWRFIGLTLVILAFIATPIYKKMKTERDLKICKGNIEQVSKAILLYAGTHDDRFPPAFAENPNAAGVPQLEGGIPVTWVTSVSQYMNDGGDFGCPAADATELCYNVSPTGDAPIKSAFGMSAGMVTQPIMLLDAPHATVFLAESSNNGAMKTHNPEPFLTPEGATVKHDGFLIGYDNIGGNIKPDATTDYMTRLAFYNSGVNDFASEKVKPRHEGGLYAIFADGHLGKLVQTDARVMLLHDEPQGFWRAK